MSEDAKEKVPKKSSRFQLQGESAIGSRVGGGVGKYRGVT